MRIRVIFLILLSVLWINSLTAQKSNKKTSISKTSTTNSNNQPLLVVDGTIVTTIDDIQPQLVKSIDLLKGAPASIYGSRGSNVVIIITLLKGSENRKNNTSSY